MKTILLYLLLTTSMYANASDQNVSRGCHEVIHEIDSLKKEKAYNASSKIASLILGGAYVYGLSNKEIDVKIRLLRLELTSCK